jgi:putrescine transport system substrate-binding protein
MKKLWFFVTLGLALSSCDQVTDTPPEEDKVLNVYTWIDYLPNEVIKQFEAETGIHVNLDYYDSNDVLEAKLLTGHSGYDVVFPTAFPYLQRQIIAGAYEPLNRQSLENWSYLDDELLERLRKADPDNQYAVPYLWGTNGIGYNVDCLAKLGIEPPYDHAGLLFDPEIARRIAPHGISFLDSPSEVYPAVLAYLGLDPNSVSLTDLQKATQQLIQVRPYVRHFSSIRFINDLANGESCIAQGWSGDIMLAQRQAKMSGNGVRIDYVIPREGAEIWCDVMAIPKRPPHPRNAHKFIGYLMRPEVIATISNQRGYANGNKASTPLLNPELQNNLAIYPTAEMRKKLYVIQPMTLALERQRTRLWTRVKTNQ